MEKNNKTPSLDSLSNLLSEKRKIIDKMINLLDSWRKWQLIILAKLALYHDKKLDEEENIKITKMIINSFLVICKLLAAIEKIYDIIKTLDSDAYRDVSENSLHEFKFDSQEKRTLKDKINFILISILALEFLISSEDEDVNFEVNKSNRGFACYYARIRQGLSDQNDFKVGVLHIGNSINIKLFANKTFKQSLFSILELVKKLAEKNNIFLGYESQEQKQESMDNYDDQKIIDESVIKYVDSAAFFGKSNLDERSGFFECINTSPIPGMNN